MQAPRLFDARGTQAEPNRLDSEIDAIRYALDGGLSLYILDRDGPYGILFGSPESIAEALDYLTTSGLPPHNFALSAGTAIAFIEADGLALERLTPSDETRPLFGEGA